MFKAEITVTLRQAILDVQGKTVEHSLHSLGYTQINGVRIGKYITLLIDEPDATAAEATARKACVQLLTNPVMEDYELTIRPVEQEATA